uniref:Uncharacterized protein n=1 Tax=Magallana gigas TaxID=29159 RepID=A0A8W8J5Z1_MAGGI
MQWNRDFVCLSQQYGSWSPAGEYDANGAMLFVVATILVYAGAVVAFIAGHIKKRRFNNEE